MLLNKGIFIVILYALSACSEQDFTECVRTAQMPDNLKMEHYRGTTPKCVPNGRTIDVKALQTLLNNSKKPPLLIDVLPLLLQIDESFGNTWLQNEVHYSLPEATWLPNVGYGKIDANIKHYLLENLKSLTNDDKNRPIVFFCIEDCWMSWNTVQRVRDYGYTQVYWFRSGTDGWGKLGLQLNEVKPVALGSPE